MSVVMSEKQIASAAHTCSYTLCGRGMTAIREAVHAFIFKCAMTDGPDKIFDINKQM